MALDPSNGSNLEQLALKGLIDWSALPRKLECIYSWIDQCRLDFAFPGSLHKLE